MLDTVQVLYPIYSSQYSYETRIILILILPDEEKSYGNNV